MGAVDLKSMEGNSRIRPANGRSSRSAHGVGREGESELRERERVGAGGWREVARLQCGVRGWPGKRLDAGTWRRPANPCLWVGEAERALADRHDSCLLTPRAATSETGAAARRAVPADGGPTDGEASTTPSTGRGEQGIGDAR